MLFLKAGWGPYQLADRVVVLFRCNGRKIVRFATQSVTEYNRKQSQEKVVWQRPTQNEVSCEEVIKQTLPHRLCSWWNTFLTVVFSEWALCSFDGKFAYRSRLGSRFILRNFPHTPWACRQRQLETSINCDFLLSLLLLFGFFLSWHSCFLLVTNKRKEQMRNQNKEMTHESREFTHNWGNGPLLLETLMAMDASLTEGCVMRVCSKNEGKHWNESGMINIRVKTAWLT